MDVVYIETTIPSAYFDDRKELGSAARRMWTREWWDKRRSSYDLVTSVAVFEELSGGDHPRREEKVNLITGVRLLPLASEVKAIADVYIREFVMPKDAGGDALHLAMASCHQCDILLTWNCRHLANANKFDHIRKINDSLGLKTPLLITPLELMGDKE